MEYNTPMTTNTQNYETFEQVLSRTYHSMEERYPIASRHADLRREIARHHAYIEWRAQRVYHHSEVSLASPSNINPVIRRRATISFYQDEQADGRIATTVITEPEAWELLDQLAKALGATVSVA